MDNAKYIVDTSVLIRRSYGDYYDEQAYPTHWHNFDKLVQEGIIISIDMVQKELTRKNHDEFEEYIDTFDSMFKPLDSPALEIHKTLSIDFKEWFDKNLRKNSIADAPLIAYAKAHNLVLVTNETYNWNKDTKEYNYKIPVICELIGARCVMKTCENSYNQDKYDFECICFNELVKREKLFEL